MNNAHPGLPDFVEYIKPGSLEEASYFLSQHAGESRPFLGGTDCIVRIRDGAWKTKYLVDVKGLDGTRTVSFDPLNGLTIGAAVSMNKAASTAEVQKFYPGLVEAFHWVASYQLRSRATIVGNICNASPAGDTIGMSMLYEGVLRVFGSSGYRDESLVDFFKSPGKTTLQSGDIAVSVSFPVPDPAHAARYVKLGRNRLGDLAIVGVSVLGRPDATAVSGYRFGIVLASVAPIPLRLPVVEELLSNQRMDEALIAQAAQMAMDSCKPIDDTRGSARYRSLMVRNLTRGAVTDVWTRIRK